VRVLSIVPFPILPPTHGGRVRAYQLAKGLARAGARVDLCCPWHPGLPLRRFEQEGITIRPFVFAANLLPALLGDRLISPLLQLSLQPFPMGPKRLLRESKNYDLVEFHFCAYASWMTRLSSDTPVVYSAHNVESDYARIEPSSGIRRLVAAQIGRLERRAVNASDLVITCTEADGKRLAELYGKPKRLAVIANGFSEDEVSNLKGSERDQIRAELGLNRDDLAILFIGGPPAHNRRAVRYLEEKLLPDLDGSARLLVLGECARPRREGRVLALGHVERLGPLMAAADVAVNPIEAGSGSNVKLAEYLAAGLPVVTTRVGLRGYEAFAHLVTVAEMNDFADAVRAQRRAGERRLEVAELGWNALGRRLYAAYADLLSGRTPDQAKSEAPLGR
jgi:glycosyltransferase involved in cell wall biosynthesis